MYVSFDAVSQGFLPPANEVCEGYVFTRVCHSVHGGGVCVVALGVCVVALERGHAWLLGGCVVAPGGHACLLRGACMVAPEGACMVAPGGCMVAPGECMCGCSGGVGGHTWDTTRYGDTINERAVRILLECILFFLEIH